MLRTSGSFISWPKRVWLTFAYGFLLLHYVSAVVFAPRVMATPLRLLCSFLLHSSVLDGFISWVVLLASTVFWFAHANNNRTASPVNEGAFLAAICVGCVGGFAFVLSIVFGGITLRPNYMTIFSLWTTHSFPLLFGFNMEALDSLKRIVVALLPLVLVGTLLTVIVPFYSSSRLHDLAWGNRPSDGSRAVKIPPQNLIGASIIAINAAMLLSPVVEEVLNGFIWFVSLPLTSAMCVVAIVSRVYHLLNDKAFR